MDDRDTLPEPRRTDIPLRYVPADDMSDEPTREGRLRAALEGVLPFVRHKTGCEAVKPISLIQKITVCTCNKNAALAKATAALGEK